MPNLFKASRMKSLPWAVLALLALPAQAQPTTAELQARTQAALCAQCHGTNGRGTPGGVLPPLAGMPAGYIEEQLKAFKSGARPATVMHQLAKGYSDAQLSQLAAYFAAQPR
jgi:cytochrome subunit of sulfide dehydrogenase